jgi:hypothetical protein
MEIAAVVAVVLLALTRLAALYLRWRVSKLAVEEGRTVEISGSIPLAPTIRLGGMVEIDDREVMPRVQSTTGEKGERDTGEGVVVAIHSRRGKRRRKRRRFDQGISS